MKNPEHTGGGDYHARLTIGFAMMHDDTPGVKGMTFAGESLGGHDDITDNWENPLLDYTVREIIIEVAEMRINKTLMPFVEGQHIGMVPQPVRLKKLTRAQHTKLHNERMTRHREDMLGLRARNDRTMDSILERRV